MPEQQTAVPQTAALQNPRFDFLDLLKAFGIICVIFGHGVPESNPYRIWVYIFHMPLFFFISGFLMSDRKCSWANKDDPKNFLRQVWGKVKRLLVPYWVFLLVLIPLYAKLKHISFSGRALLNDLFFIKGTITSDLDANALWFLPTLFILWLVCAVFVRIFPQFWAQCLFVLLCIAGVALLDSKQIPHNFGLLRCLAVLPFYMVGFWARKWCAALDPQGKLNPVASDQTKPAKAGCLSASEAGSHLPDRGARRAGDCMVRRAIAAVLLVLGSALGIANGKVSLHQYKYGHALGDHWSYLVLFAAGVLMICGFFLWAQTLRNPSALTLFIGQNSLFIMATHQYWVNLFQNNFLRSKITEGAMAYSVALFAVGLCLVLGLIARMVGVVPGLRDVFGVTKAKP